MLLICLFQQATQGNVVEIIVRVLCALSCSLSDGIGENLKEGLKNHVSVSVSMGNGARRRAKRGQDVRNEISCHPQASYDTCWHTYDDHPISRFRVVKDPPHFLGVHDLAGRIARKGSSNWTKVSFSGFQSVMESRFRW